MPSKKPTPLSLESFDAPSKKEIQIYTDSRDRIPKTVTGTQTPFNGKSDQEDSSGPGPASKVGKRARKQDKMDDQPLLYDQYDKYDQYETEYVFDTHHLPFVFNTDIHFTVPMTTNLQQMMRSPVLVV